MFFKAIPKRKFILFAGDISIILFSAFLAFILRINEVINFLDIYIGASLIILIVFLCIFYIADLYNLQQNFKSFRGMTKVIVSILVGAILISFLFYFLLPYQYGRGIFLIQILTLTPLVYMWRTLFKTYFKAVFKPKRVLLMAKDWTSTVLYEALKGNPEFMVLGLVNGDVELIENPFPTGTPVLNIDEVDEMVTAGYIDGMVIDLIEKQPNGFWRSLLKFKMSGVEIIGAGNLYQDLTGKVPIRHVNDRWFVSTPGYALLTSNFIQRFKRLLDLVISSTFLTCTLPLMGLIALLIKLDSTGPVFYKQKRFGQNEREFELIKFRTMVYNAEENTGAVWAGQNDARITRVGKILRLTRFDELPQMINVLKEEMSFIGPRPERPEFVNDLKEKIPYYSLRHSVKPGITGWAQVNYRYGASVEDAIEKLQYDLFYIQNMSLLLELRILLKTIHVVLFGKGSR